jgi:hypothetical protein
MREVIMQLVNVMSTASKTTCQSRVYCREIVVILRILQINHKLKFRLRHNSFNVDVGAQTTRCVYGSQSECHHAILLYG